MQPNGSNPAGNTLQAFLTILFFDERFNFIAAADGGVAQQQVAASVGSNGSTLALANIKAPKNGYAYVYVSNQSNNDVYFDDLVAGIVQGNIAEENHYYSFGLKIAGLSSKKLGDNYEGQLKNNYLYQGAFSELDDETGWTDFMLRDYDAQIGRFIQQDPYTQFPSPYTGMANDPINTIDPSGGIGLPCPGTSGLAIFLDNAIYSVGRFLTNNAALLSKISIGINILKTGVFITQAIETSSMINGQITSMQVGAATVTGQTASGIEKETTYWILYDGSTVNIYDGTYGDKENSTLIESLAGTSGGIGYQNSSKQNIPKKGPVPDGDYTINLSISPRNRKVSYSDDGQTNQDVGIQQMTDRKGTGFNAEWGRWRARLEKDNVGSSRDNFYFHDSYKGYSHGCIETETRLFYFFLSLHDDGVSTIKVKVSYPNKNTSTNGGTKNLKPIVPDNVKPYYKKYGYPPEAMGNRNYGKMPVPPAPYKYVPKQ